MNELNGDQIQKWFEEWARLSTDRSAWQYIADKVLARPDAAIRSARLESLRAVEIFAHRPSTTWESLYEYLEKQIGVVQVE